MPTEPELNRSPHQPAARNIRPDWSPNGHQIAFASGPNGNETIYVMNADGSDLSPLTSGNAPDWSPNGRQILFQSTRDGNSEIYVIDADGSNQRRLTFYAGPDLDADWSPDGRTIAFERERNGPSDLTLQQVFVLDVYARGAEPEQLTFPPSENGHPGWAGGRVRRLDLLAVPGERPDRGIDAHAKRDDLAVARPGRRHHLAAPVTR